MKKMLLIAVIALCGIAAQAQNKIFEKYAQMEGVEYVCINKAMFSAGLSIATGGQVVVDEANTQGTDLSKFANYNRMIIITAKGDKKLCTGICRCLIHLRVLQGTRSEA